MHRQGVVQQLTQGWVQQVVHVWVQQVVLQRTATDSNNRQETQKTSASTEVKVANALSCTAVQLSRVPPRGNAHGAETSGKSGFPSGQRAKRSAIELETPPIDPDLAAVVDAWPKLPEAIRAGILAMIRAAE